MPNPNPKAALRAFGLTALRHVAGGNASQRVVDPLMCWLSMGFAGRGMNGRDEGRRRHERSRVVGSGALMIIPTLSLDEINALRRVAYGLASFLPSVRRVRLATLGLVAVNGGGRLVLTRRARCTSHVRTEHKSQAADDPKKPNSRSAAALPCPNTMMQRTPMVHHARSAVCY